MFPSFLCEKFTSSLPMVKSCLLGHGGLACWGVTEQSEDSDLGVTGLGVGGEGTTQQSSEEGAKMFYLNFILIEASSCGC